MASIGETLREARKKKGISEEAASKTLKIKIERLRDLEEDKYDGFPAYVYIRSFLRHYAEYLGLESAPLIQQFSEQVPAPEQKAVFEITEDQRSRSPIQRHVSMPTSSSPMSVSSTGKTVLIASIAVLGVAGACAYWILKMPPPAALPATPVETVPAATTNASSHSSSDWDAPVQSSVPVAPLSLSSNVVPEARRP